MEIPEAGIKLDLKFVETLGQASEGARHAVAMLRDVARTLDGLDTAYAVTLHAEFAEKFGRLSAVTKRIKAVGAVVKWGAEADFAKAGMVPPVLCHYSEIADKIYKLRKLGGFPADKNLQLDVPNVLKHFSDRWEK